MDHVHRPPSTKRRPVNLTIAEPLLVEMKALGINASRAAEEGISAAIRQAKAARWLAENAQAIDAHNAAIDTNGLPLTPLWMQDHGAV